MWWAAVGMKVALHLSHSVVRQWQRLSLQAAFGFGLICQEVTVVSSGCARRLALCCCGMFSTGPVCEWGGRETEREREKERERYMQKDRQTERYREIDKQKVVVRNILLCTS